MVVSSYGRLAALTTAPGAAYPASASIVLYNQFRATYAQIYRTQPNVRICVDFIARNIAQLGLHTFRRTSDTDRERLTDHPVARTIGRPNPATSRFRFIRDTVSDLAIFDNAFWLKVRVPEQIGLVRLPADQVTVGGGLLPDSYSWCTGDGEEHTFAPSEIVHFRGYDPLNPLQGLSPLESLRRVLAEEIASRDYREGFWRNSARMSAVIERPVAAPKWNREQKLRFTSEWQQQFSGGAAAGKTAVLEDGMVLKEMSYSSQESQFIEARKLAREEVAAAYHIPLPMVGILEHATFSNIKEQHKHLYQDCLGPWLVMLEEDIERQLLSEWRDSEAVYVEFNIAEKLKGSFEEQAASLRALVGKPIMTANEGRARLNLPKSARPEDDQLADPTYIDDGTQDERREAAKQVADPEREAA